MVRKVRGIREEKLRRVGKNEVRKIAIIWKRKKIKGIRGRRGKKG